MQIISCSKWRDTQNVQSYSSLDLQLMDPSSETIKWFKNDLKNTKLKYLPSYYKRKDLVQRSSRNSPGRMKIVM